MYHSILPSLFWFSIEFLGLFLTCIEIFSPERADKIQDFFKGWRNKLNRKYDDDLYQSLWGLVWSLNARTERDDSEKEKFDDFSRFVLIITPILSVTTLLLGLAFGFPLTCSGLILLTGGLIVIVRYMKLSWKILFLLAPGRELGAIGILISSIGLIKGAIEIFIQLLV